MVKLDFFNPTSPLVPKFAVLIGTGSRETVYKQGSEDLAQCTNWFPAR